VLRYAPKLIPRTVCRLSPRRNLYTEASGSYLIRILSFPLFYPTSLFPLFSACSVCSLYTQTGSASPPSSPTSSSRTASRTPPFLSRPGAPRQRRRARAVYQGLLCAYSIHAADARCVGPGELVLPCIFDAVLGGAFVGVVV
jgi:hypothetical protein